MGWLGQGIDLHRLVSSTTHQSCHRIRDGRLGQEVSHKDLSKTNVRRDPLDLKETSDRHRRLLHDDRDLALLIEKVATSRLPLLDQAFPRHESGFEAAD